MVYRVSFRTVKATQKNLVSKIQMNKQGASFSALFDEDTPKHSGSISTADHLVRIVVHPDKTNMSPCLPVRRWDHGRTEGHEGSCTLIVNASAL